MERGNKGDIIQGTTSWFDTMSLRTVSGHCTMSLRTVSGHCSIKYLFMLELSDIKI